MPVDVDLARYAGRGRELVLETRGYEETGDAGRAFWGAPAVTSARARRRSRSSTWWTRCAPTTPASTATRARRRPSSTPSRRTRSSSTRRSRTRRGRSPRWPRSSPRSLPGAAPRRAAARPARPLARRRSPSCSTSAASSTGAAIANSVIYGAESAFDRGFDFFAGLHGEDDRRSKLVGRRRGGGLGARVPALAARACRPSSTCTRWTRTCPTRRPRPSIGCSSRTRPTGHPARDPRTDYKEPLDRERMIAQYDGDVAFGDREFGRFVRELKAARALRRRARRLPRRPRRGVPRPRALAARPQPLRRAHPHPAGREVPRQRAARAGAWPSRCRASTCCRRVLEAMGLPLPVATSPGRPLQRALAGGGEAAPGARRDQPPRLRRPRRAHRGRQVHPPLQPRRRRALLRPRAATPERRRASPRRSPSACGCCRRRPRRAWPEPVPLRGAGRAARAASRCALETHGWLEAVETTGLRAGGALGRRRQRALGSSSRLQPAPGAPREIGFTRAARWARRCTLLGHARRPAAAHRRRRRRRALRSHPDAFPFRLPDIESETDSDRGLDAVQGAGPRARPACASGWRCRRAARSTSWTRRPARG